MFSKSCSRRKLPSCIWLVFGCAYLQPVIVEAEPIQINNFGFEAIELGATEWTRPTGSLDGFGGIEIDDPIPSWTVTNRHPAMFYGTQNTNADPMRSLPPEGSNVAWAYGADIVQQLDAVLKANTRYTLQVDISKTREFPTYAIQLLAGSNVLVEDNNSILCGTCPSPTPFSTSTLVFDTTPDDPRLEEPLSINLRSFGIEMNFDNVRLDAAPVPEPTAAVLLALGLLPLTLRKWPV